MRYFATLKHHSAVGHWEELKSTTLQDAKREASEQLSSGLHGSEIHLVSIERIQEEESLSEDRRGLNYLVPWIKTVPFGSWQTHE